jgi:transcriptional/translational regulatory protein YebC/TACO1
VSEGLVPEALEITQRAAASAELTGDKARAMVRLLETLEAIDGVRNVYSNAQVPDEVLAAV